MKLRWAAALAANRLARLLGSHRTGLRAWCRTRLWSFGWRITQGG